MAMTVTDAAKILKCVYDNAPYGKTAVRIHLFGIKYADELADISSREVVSRAGIPHGYAAEIDKGRNLAEYVVIKPGVDLCA